MDNQIINVEANKDDALFNQIAKAGDWLPRLQLFSGATDAAKQGLIPMNNWGLVNRKDEITDLGKEVDILIIDWRAKALDTSIKQKIKNHYDHTSKDFQDTVAKSEVKDSGCMYGPEFLVWIPSQKTFAHLFMCSKTARTEAKRVKAEIGKAATLSSKTIKTDRYIWQGPVCKPLSTTLPILPDEEKWKAEQLKFKNPKQTEVEEIPAEQAGKTDDRDR